MPKKCVTQLLAHRRYLMNAIFLFVHQELKTESPGELECFITSISLAKDV